MDVHLATGDDDGLGSDGTIVHIAEHGVVLMDVARNVKGGTTDGGVIEGESDQLGTVSGRYGPVRIDLDDALHEDEGGDDLDATAATGRIVGGINHEFALDVEAGGDGNGTGNAIELDARAAVDLGRTGKASEGRCGKDLAPEAARRGRGDIMKDRVARQRKETGRMVRSMTHDVHVFHERSRRSRRLLRLLLAE